MESARRPNHETDSEPRPQAFNFGALDVEQVKLLNSAVEEKLARMMEQDPNADTRQGDALLDLLQAAFEEQAGTEHGRSLLLALKADSSHYSRAVAAHGAAAFIPHDYELARDVVLDLRHEVEGLDNFR